MTGRPEDDQTDNPWEAGPAGADDDDAEMARIIETALKNSEAEPDEDTAGFDAPLDDKPRTSAMVDVEEGASLASKAKLTKPAAEEPEAQDQPEAETPAATEAKPAEAAPEAQPETPAATPAPLDIAALTEGLDDTRKAEVTRRLTESTAVLDLFKAHDAELQRHGMKPAEAMSRLMDLNAFAQEKPGEYIAWVAQQTGEDPQAALTQAAELLGYKLVKADEDDPFEDDAIKQLKAENARLRGEQVNFGPDAPQYRAQRSVAQQINDFRSERDASTGTLKRPLFDTLRDVISSRAQAYVSATGKPVTVEDLDRIYQAVEAEAKQALGLPATSAAQPQKTVAPQGQTQAADLAKAKQASSSIDGSGQGANRQPALSDDAPLSDVIKFHAGRLGIG